MASLQQTFSHTSILVLLVIDESLILVSNVSTLGGGQENQAFPVVSSNPFGGKEEIPGSSNTDKRGLEIVRKLYGTGAFPAILAYVAERRINKL